LPALIKAVERNLDGLFLLRLGRYPDGEVGLWRISIGRSVRPWRVFRAR